MRVKVTNAAGIGLSGIDVVFSADQGSVTGTTVKTGNDGVASVSWTLGTVAGSSLTLYGGQHAFGYIQISESHGGSYTYGSELDGVEWMPPLVGGKHQFVLRDPTTARILLHSSHSHRQPRVPPC
ncbi:MAG TPA: Ig-like domain-containing protein [Longimicrobiales bacterium]